MGIFDKLKAAKNFVTGGSADVVVDAADDARIGEPFKVEVAVRVGDAPLEVRRVYVKVRSVEIVDMPDNSNSAQYDVEATPQTRDANDPRYAEEETYEAEVILHGAVDLDSNAQANWEGEITLPASCMPTYRGRNAKHRWLIFAGLDVAGNDPDSGWSEFQVR